MLRLKVRARGADEGDLSDALRKVIENLRSTPGGAAGKGSGWSYTIGSGRAARLRLTIETENAAFEGRGRDHELARILRRLADEIEREGAARLDGEKLRDVNGNTVGRVTYRKARREKASS
jgi:Zn-dependent M32 family carboxypeptidase